MAGYSFPTGVEDGFQLSLRTASPTSSEQSSSAGM